MAEFSLNLSSLKLSDIPDQQTITNAAERVLDSSASWKEGKTFHGVVKTFHNTSPSGDSWHVRVSQHTDTPFQTFWNFLGENKPENEQQFIPEIKYFNEAPIEQVQALNPKISAPVQRLISTFYHLPPPTSDRVFTVLQTTKLSEGSPRKGIIVSIPVNLADSGFESLEIDKDKTRTKGRYVSVERILELEDGTIEWRMATSSTPGGLIPQFIVDRSLPNNIAADVPRFINWIKASSHSA